MEENKECCHGTGECKTIGLTYGEALFHKNKFGIIKTILYIILYTSICIM